MIQHGPQSRSFGAAPINPAWILAGDPQAHGMVLSETPDQAVLTVLWRCTPGKFEWHYDYDESVYFLSGEATIRDLETGIQHHVDAGASMMFTRGSSAEWTVTKTVTKIAMVHSPLSRKLRALQSLWWALKGRPRLVGRLA
jgi:uncharacterized protein